MAFMAPGPESFKTPTTEAEHIQVENEVESEAAAAKTEDEVQKASEKLSSLDGSDFTPKAERLARYNELNAKLEVKKGEIKDLQKAQDLTKDSNADWKKMSDQIDLAKDPTSAIDKSKLEKDVHSKTDDARAEISRLAQVGRPGNAVAQARAHNQVIKLLKAKLEGSGMKFLSKQEADPRRKDAVIATAKNDAEFAPGAPFAKAIETFNAAKTGGAARTAEIAKTALNTEATNAKDAIWAAIDKEIFPSDSTIPVVDNIDDVVDSYLARIQKINEAVANATKPAGAPSGAPDAADAAPDKAKEEKDLQESSQKALNRIFEISTNNDRGPTAVKDAREQNAILAANRKTAETKGISHLSKIDARRDAAKDLSAAKDSANASINDATFKKAIEDFKKKDSPTEADKNALKDAAKTLKDKIWTVDLASESSTAITKNADEIIAVHLDAIAQINKQVDEALGVDGAKATTDKPADAVTEKEQSILEKILKFLEKLFKEMREGNAAIAETPDSIRAQLRVLDEEKKGLTEKLGKTTDKNERADIQKKIDDITIKENELNRRLTDSIAANRKLATDLDRSAEGSAIKAGQDAKGNVVLSARDGFTNQQFQNQVQYMQNYNQYAKRYIQPGQGRTYNITSYYAGRDLFINSNGNNSGNTINSNNNNGSNRGNFTDNRRFDNRSFDNRVDNSFRDNRSFADNRRFDNRVDNRNINNSRTDNRVTNNNNAAPTRRESSTGSGSAAPLASPESSDPPPEVRRNVLRQAEIQRLRHDETLRLLQPEDIAKLRRLEEEHNNDPLTHNMPKPPRTVDTTPIPTATPDRVDPVSGAGGGLRGGIGRVGGTRSGPIGRREAPRTTTPKQKPTKGTDSVKNGANRAD